MCMQAHRCKHGLSARDLWKGQGEASIAVTRHSHVWHQRQPSCAPPPRLGYRSARSRPHSGRWPTECPATRACAALARRLRSYNGNCQSQRPMIHMSVGRWDIQSVSQSVRQVGRQAGTVVTLSGGQEAPPAMTTHNVSFMSEATCCKPSTCSCVSRLHIVIHTHICEHTKT
jgi:hypothetical protein